MPNNNLSSKIEESIQYSRTNEHLIQDEKETLDRILKYCQAIYVDTQKIRRFMFWRTVIKVIGLVIILTPIIFAFIYLPPFLQGAYNDFQGLLGVGQSGSDLLKQLQQLK